MSAVSSTFEAHWSVHFEKRAISLSLKVLPFQPRLARNRVQVRNSVRPMHLFGHTFDHDYYFELPREGERDTHSITRCFAPHHRDVRAFPRTNRTFSTARNPIPSAASSTNAPPAFVPSPPWRFSVLAAKSGGHTSSAIPGRTAPSLAPLPLTENATTSCLVS